MKRLVTGHVHPTNNLPSLVKIIDQIHRCTSDCAEVLHPAVLPEEGMLSWDAGGGVYYGVRQRPSRNLPVFVYKLRERIRAAQRAQVPHAFALPDKGAALLRNTHAETKRVRHVVRRTSDHLPAVVDTGRSALISS